MAGLVQKRVDCSLTALHCPGNQGSKQLLRCQQMEHIDAAPLIVARYEA